MTKTILITGATGLIGKQIVNALLQRGDKIISLSTNAAAAQKKMPATVRIVRMNDFMQLKNDKIDAIINLAGRNLADKRWSEEFKSEVLNSRVETTDKIIELISTMKIKPEVLVSASGVDYYGDTGDKNIYEDSPAADDYMGGMCKAWEAAAMKAVNYGVRAAIIRTGFVIAKNSTAVDKLALPFKFFVGGPIGSGKQFVSWIHMDDVVGIYLFAIDHVNVSGVINAAAPNPERMKDFCKHMARVLHRPSIFPVPDFVVKIVAGEMAQVVLAGRKALPDKIIGLGYKFKYEQAINAWKDVF